MPLDPRLSHQPLKIRQLVEDYRSGRIVIPEFQRDYVWRPRQAPRLIDSLYKGYPISSLLLWQSSDEVRPRRRDPRPLRSSTVQWLIDGQQRIITLSRAMSGDEGIDVVFHPGREEFRLANAATRKDPEWKRLAELWDDELYRQVRRNMDGSRHADRLEQRFERVRGILDYEVPVVSMIDHDFEAAVEAFSRINTLGVRLKREDIHSAQVAVRHTGFIADEVAPFLDRLRQQGFRRLTIMHLFRACAFIATPDGRSRTPLHELERREVLSAWRQAQRATDQAIALIRSELGLVNMGILSSGALLVPVIALCAIMPPRQRDAPGLVGWLALAALSHRYSGAAETALDQDLRACRNSDPIGDLLRNLRNERGSLSASPEDFAGSLVDRSGILALYIACKHRGLLDFYTGGKVILQDNIGRHHILPRGQFPEKARTAADTIANMAFIAGDVNRAIGLTGPEVYLAKLETRVLQSQCIPTDSGLWRVDQADRFWHARRELLAESFNDYTRSALPQRRL